MPLQQNIDFKNGVVAPKAYLEISNIQLDYDQKVCNLTVKTYLSIDVKLKGLQSIKQETFNISDNPMFQGGINQSGIQLEKKFTAFFSTSNPLEAAEDYLLTLEQYKTAIKI